jgi:predicted Zn-dependent protease
MKILWNTLVISLGLLLPTSSSIVLAQSLKTAVGESVANKVKRQLPLMEDEHVLNYVNEVGNKLALVAGRNHFEY